MAERISRVLGESYEMVPGGSARLARCEAGGPLSDAPCYWFGLLIHDIYLGRNVKFMEVALAARAKRWTYSSDGFRIVDEEET